ncbi:MAG TPA: RNA methyltransferase [Candidatus Saccharimonadales bacterium]|nr:RNA methyltransferase [Candidatus Saccharimonadales bacterium]
MKHITSSQNPLIKTIKALRSQAKSRRESGQTILEGIHLAESYLDNNFVPMLCVTNESAQVNPEVERILDRCDALGVKYVSITDDQFNAISSVEQGIGLLFIVTMPKVEDLPPVTQGALLLDTIQDPANVGAMLRTAAAAGVHDVYCSSGTASVWSPKVLRVGMGAHFSLNIYENVDLVRVITESNIPVRATTIDAKTTLYETDLSEPCAWLMGNEGQGVSKALLELNVDTLTIPQSENVESLNVAAATAVCLFEQRRQKILLTKR